MNTAMHIQCPPLQQPAQSSTANPQPQQPARLPQPTYPASMPPTTDTTAAAGQAGPGQQQQRMANPAATTAHRDRQTQNGGEHYPMRNRCCSRWTQAPARHPRTRALNQGTSTNPPHGRSQQSTSRRGTRAGTHTEPSTQASKQQAAAQGMPSRNHNSPAHKKPTSNRTEASTYSRKPLHQQSNRKGGHKGAATSHPQPNSKRRTPNQGGAEGGMPTDAPITKATATRG